MSIAVEHVGPAPGTGSVPLVFLHGFTQTRRSWLPVIDRLERRRSCTLVDAPGHGGSHDGARSLWECADDISAAAGPGVLVGYSMGARMALHCVLAHPHRWHGLVLVSGTAGIEDDTERAARRDDDRRLAARIEEIGVERFLDEWLALPLFAGLSPDAADRRDRARNSARGLADSLRHAGTGTQEPLWSRLDEISVPVLVVTGERDTKFTELGRRLARRIDGAFLVVVPDAGHTVHLERPEALADALSAWLG
jgi:2-succinyl-6-hydroxy-2,4-cyclohexadiene-1-carboxylate synthase